MIVILGLSACGCKSRKSPTQPRSSLSASEIAAPAPVVEQLLLTGTFERVARAASGTASIYRRGDDYELRLSAVTVAQEGTVRVYLVGHEHADSTRIVGETEMKYDMAELEQGAAEQRIPLPSQPDPALRSVVLFNPAFGVNLAVAALRPLMTAR